MIVLLHPRTVRRARNRRFPLAPLSLAAVLEGRENYEIVDENIDRDPMATINTIAQREPIELLAVSVMPGPQMVSAIALSKQFRAQHPNIPIVWGGYFPSLYADATMNAPYVDYGVRGQGEDTFVELLAALRNRTSLQGIKGLSFRDDFGLTVHTPDRAIKSPGDFPWLPYHRLRDAHKYIQPTFLGKRTAVHHASFGCPYRCKFCAVPATVGSRQKCESPERTAQILTHLQREFAIDSVQFYDNNFFLRQDHAAKLAALLTPLNIKWWCEGRIDVLLSYSDETMRALRRSGCEMIFFGAESGNDAVLLEMGKQLTADQILRIAERIRDFGITPEFSFVIGNPHEPDRDLRDTMAFIRRIKRLNPRSEIIIQHYVPTPHPDGMYGEIDDKIQFPRTPEEWASPRWYNFTVRQDTALPWLPRDTKRLIDWFETVMECRWPTVQDITMPAWARGLLQSLSTWRYATGFYHWPVELELARRFVDLRRPKVESL